MINDPGSNKQGHDLQLSSIPSEVLDVHLIEPLVLSELEEAHVLPVDTVYHSLFGVSKSGNLKWK